MRLRLSAFHRWSYLERLGATNGIRAERVLAQSSWLESRQDSIKRLAIVSGQSRETLLHAIPQLGQEPGPFLTDHPDFSVNAPCRLCVARRTGSYSHFSRVSVWSSRFHDQVCLRHKIWTGRSAENYMQQVDVTDLPDVLQAQRRHYRLLRKHGHVVLSACFEHCSDLWDAVVRRGYRPATAAAVSASWASAIPKSGTPAATSPSIPRSSRPPRSTPPLTGGSSRAPRTADTSTSGPSSSASCHRNGSFGGAASRGSSKNWETPLYASRTP